MVKNIFAWIIIFCGLCISTAQAKVTAYVNKNPVIVGQPIVLTIQSDASHDQSDLDLSQFKQKFDIGHVSFSQSTQIINGDVSRQSTWNAVFYIDEPKNVTIGPFSIGQEQSSSFELEVLPETASSKQQRRSNEPTVFLDSALNLREAYLGQILHYKLKLSMNAELQSGQLSTPEVQGLTFTQVGKDYDAIEMVQGQRFRVITRDYIVKLNQTGNFTIPPAVFQGDMIIPSQSRQGFFSTRRSKPVRVRSKAAELKVLEPVATFNEPWLVADQLTLTDDWSETPGDIEVGTPITRTITLTGINSDLDLVQPMDIALPAGVKSYPEKPERTQEMYQGNVISKMKTSYAIVPREAGALTLPEIKLAWWDHQSQTQKWLTLPAKHYNIILGEQSKSPQDAEATLPLAINPQSDSAQTTQDATPISIWAILACVFAVLWTLSLIMAYAFYKRKQKAKIPNIKTQVQPSGIADFKSACMNEDVIHILQRVAPWFETKLNEPLSIAQLQQLYPELSMSLTQLQHMRYQPNDHQSFDGKAFFELCESCIQQKAQGKNETLTALYP